MQTSSERLDPDQAAQEDVIRLLAVGIAMTEQHAMLSTGPRPEDWKPGPNTMHMARRALSKWLFNGMDSADPHMLSEALNALGMERVGWWCESFGFTYAPTGDLDCHDVHHTVYRTSVEPHRHSWRVEGDDRPLRRVCEDCGAVE